MQTHTPHCTRMLTFVACLVVLVGSTSFAAEPSDYLPPENQHSLLNANMPPGVVGQSRLMSRGPVANYYQPVEFKGPDGVRFALPQGNVLAESDENLMAGLLIGGVYRFQISRIPRLEGAELYPTVELIDRTYPPPGLATSFPIPITIDQTDMEAALQGKLVTRVVYLEDPQTALPLQQEPQQVTTMDINESQDALGVADQFGRPVAIIRIGSVAPPREPSLLPRFYFGFPSWAPIFRSQTQP